MTIEISNDNELKKLIDTINNKHKSIDKDSKPFDSSFYWLIHTSLKGNWTIEQLKYRILKPFFNGTNNDSLSLFNIWTPILSGVPLIFVLSWVDISHIATKLKQNLEGLLTDQNVPAQIGIDQNTTDQNVIDQNVIDRNTVIRMWLLENRLIKIWLFKI